MREIYINYAINNYATKKLEGKYYYIHIYIYSI